MGWPVGIFTVTCFSHVVLAARENLWACIRRKFYLPILGVSIGRFDEPPETVEDVQVSQVARPR